MDALVFDFDGLILDTETPLYEAWRHTYEHFGLPPLDFEAWSNALGLAEHDPNMINPATEVAKHLGDSFDLETVNAVRRARRNEMQAKETIRPGVVRLLDEAAQLGIPTAIASSSPIDWIGPHLDTHDLSHRFQFISSVDDNTPGKPHPATYLNACRALGANPLKSVALEDSPNGASAAKAAGLFCIGVPAGVSAHLDFSHADMTVSTLEHVDLASLIRP